MNTHMYSPVLTTLAVLLRGCVPIYMVVLCYIHHLLSTEREAARRLLPPTPPVGRDHVLDKNAVAWLCV